MRHHDRIRGVYAAAGVVVAVTVFGSCRGHGLATSAAAGAVLRVGVGQVSTTNPAIGVRQLAQLLSVESLARPGVDARMQPWLAERWSTLSDNRSLRLKLREGIKFHDGTPLDASSLVALFPGILKNFMGSIAEDLDRVTMIDARTIEIAFRRPSPFLIESLEAPIQRSLSIATGPFMIDSDSSTDLKANADYYLGRPFITHVRLLPFPSVRAAWAELLRGRIDVLYEVGTEALSSMQNAKNVSIFKFTRQYQHAILLNTEAAPLRSRDIRRALNASIDRGTLLAHGLNAQGIASSGPVWPQHWAFRNDLQSFGFTAERAARVLTSVGAAQLRFTCLVPPDTINERLALEVKRQLTHVNVDLRLEQASQDEIIRRIQKRQYQAALIEVISGPTLFRPYYFWHSNTPANSGGIGNTAIDKALDRVRYAASDEEYGHSVAAVQRAFVDDPPAIFLAWSVRARAISSRFVVPAPEPGREILSNLRLWKPVDERQASQN